MTALYIVFGVILFVVLSSYCVLSVATWKNFSSVNNVSIDVATATLTPLMQENFVHSLKRESKTMLLDQSILMVISAGIFAILPFDSFWYSSACILLAGFDFFHYWNLKI